MLPQETGKRDTPSDSSRPEGNVNGFYRVIGYSVIGRSAPDRGPLHSQGNFCPVRRTYASTYFWRVWRTIGAGRTGPGGVRLNWILSR